jgi:hypothetical protein
VAWDGLDEDLEALPDRQGLIGVMEERFPDEKAKALVNWSSQVWPFVKDMANGDWVVCHPSSNQACISVNSPATTTSKRQFWMTVHSWHSRAVTNPLGLQRRVVQSCK